MSLHLPEELRWLGWVAGAAWPDGDEDAAWATSRAWEAASKEITALLTKLDEAKRATLDAYPAGAAGAEMGARYDVLRTGDQSMEALAEAMLAVSDSAFDMGTELQATKLTIIVTLCWLAAEIAWAKLFPPTTAAVEAAAILTTRSFLKVMQDSVQKTIANIAARMGAPQLERHFWKSLFHGKLVAPTAKGWGVYGARAGEAVAIAGGINAAVQVGQIADDKRREFNGKEFGFSVLGGVAGALPAREIGRFLGHVSNKAGDKIIAKTGANLDNAWYRGFRGVMIGSIADGAGAIAGNLAVGVANVATGGSFADSFLSGEGWVGGFVQGALVGGARGASVYSGHIPKVGEGITPGQFRRDNWRGAVWFFPKSVGTGFFPLKPAPAAVTTDGSGHGGIPMTPLDGTGGALPAGGAPVAGGATSDAPPPGGRPAGPQVTAGGPATGSQGNLAGTPVNSGATPVANTGGVVANTGSPVQPNGFAAVGGESAGFGGGATGTQGGGNTVAAGGQFGGGDSFGQAGQSGGGSGTQGGPVGDGNTVVHGGHTDGGQSGFTGQQPNSTWYQSDSGSDTTSEGGRSPQGAPLGFGDSGQAPVNGAPGEGGFVTDTRGGQESRPLQDEFAAPGNQTGNRDGFSSTESGYVVSPLSSPLPGDATPFGVSPPGTPAGGDGMSAPPAPGFSGLGDRDGTGEGGFGGRQIESPQGGFGGDRSGQQGLPLSPEPGPSREPGFGGVPVGVGAPLGGQPPVGHGAPLPPAGDNSPPHSPNQNSGGESPANRERRTQLPKLVTSVPPPGRVEGMSGQPSHRADSPTIPGFEPIGQPGSTPFRPNLAPLGIDGSAQPPGGTPLAAPAPIAPGGNRPTFLDPPSPSTPTDPPNFLNLTPTPSPPGHPPNFLDLTPTPSPPPGPPSPPPITGDDGSSSSGASIATNDTSHSTVSGVDTVASAGTQGNLAAQHTDDKHGALGHGKDLRGKPRPQRWPNWPHMPLPFTPPQVSDLEWLPEGSVEPKEPGASDPGADPPGTPPDSTDIGRSGARTEPRETSDSPPPETGEQVQPVDRAGLAEPQPDGQVDVPFTLGRPAP
ncbi:hypothetical protein [Nocardia harenae]|uniref:WXG100-like domain-containing protein n=1 Tax=Nocardia harenae TaxID=358707 RepID=UPI0008361769|nr:hypothetical protein [Nocardia harenae]